MERRALRGFTLVELLITIAIAVLLVTVAIPAFGSLVERQRAWLVLNDLRTGLHLAREYAARHGTHATICRSADARQCGNGADWAAGWMVFEDPDAQHDCTADASGHCGHGGRVLGTGGGMRGGVRLSGNFFIQESVRYREQGFAKAANGTFTACNRDGEILGGLVVAWSGRVRPAEDGDNLACLPPA